MNLRVLIFLVVFAVIAIFTALNWSAIVAPTQLTLGFADFQAPLGLILMSLLMLVALLSLAFVVYLQTGVLLEARHHARELRANRELADQAEASRFTDLRRYLETELARIATANQAAREAQNARVDKLYADLRLALTETENTLSAYIGEMDDRLEKARDG